MTFLTDGAPGMLRSMPCGRRGDPSHLLPQDWIFRKRYAPTTIMRTAQDAMTARHVNG